MKLRRKNDMQEAGGSLDDLLYRIRDAWYALFEYNPESSWIVDVFEDTVVVRVGAPTKAKFFRLGYTITDDSVTFADKSTWVEVTLDYIEVSATEESVVLESLRGLIETNSKGEAEAVIVVEGLSANGNNYTRKALESGIAVFNGAQMFVDHPTLSESNERPERSVRDLVGKIGTPYIGKDRHGNTALKASYQLSDSADWLETLITEGIADGLSIHASGTGKRDTESGDFIVEAFVEHPFTSVDFVTVPAAGGYAALTEAHPALWSDLTESVLRQHRPDLVDKIRETKADGASEVKLLRESEDMGEIEQLKESNATLAKERDALKQDNARMFAEARSAEASGVLDGLLPANLPDEVKSRLTEQAKPAIEAFVAYGSDQTKAQLTEALKALVEAEVAYIAKLVPNGVVAGLGATESAANEADEDEFLKIMESLTGDKEKAKLAVAGR